MAKPFFSLQKFLRRAQFFLFFLTIAYLMAGSLLLLQRSYLVIQQNNRGTSNVPGSAIDGLMPLDRYLEQRMFRSSYWNTKGLAGGNIQGKAETNALLDQPIWLISRNSELRQLRRRWFHNFVSDREPSQGVISKLQKHTTVNQGTYIGCFMENVEDRTLKATVFYDLRKMTISHCQSACAERTYIYAGLSYGSECYCGNNLPPNRAKEEECNNECKGEKGSICGGVNRLSVFQLEKLPAAAKQRWSLTAERDGRLSLLLPFTGADIRYYTADNYTLMGRTNKDKGGEGLRTPRSIRPQQDLHRFLKERTSRSPHAISKMAPAPEAASRHSPEDEEEVSSDGEGTERSTKKFMKELMAESLRLVMSELAEIRADLRHTGDRVEELEGCSAAITSHSTELQHVITMQHAYINKTILAQEDNENRNRRSNVRIKGLPVSWAPDTLHKIAVELFARLLGEDRTANILIECIHRALKPMPANTDTPRDVICKLLTFPDAAAILNAARSSKDLTYEGAALQFYQDLAPSTLYRRRHLRPLLDALKAKSIKYYWLFPFGIGINVGEKRLNICSPEDLQASWHLLDIDPIDIPNWLPLPDLPAFSQLPTLGNWQIASRTKSPKTKPKKKNKDNTAPDPT